MNSAYINYINVLGEVLPSDLFNACMERVRVDGLGETYRFKLVPAMIPEELYRRNANSINRLKSARRPKRADGSPNPEFNEAVYNATVLPFEPFQPHKMTK